MSELSNEALRQCNQEHVEAIEQIKAEKRRESEKAAYWMRRAMKNLERADRLASERDDVVQTVLRISNVVGDPAHDDEIRELAEGLLSRLGVS